MATVFSKKALHEFLLIKWKEQTIEFTKNVKSRGYAAKIDKLKVILTKVIDEGGSSEEILDIEYIEVILLNNSNPNFDPSMAESNENPRSVPITDRQDINDEFHQAFQKVYSKQNVEDSSKAIHEFLDSGGDTKPSEYLKSKSLNNEEV